jgi:hypothetical protein
VSNKIVKIYKFSIFRFFIEVVFNAGVFSRLLWLRLQVVSCQQVMLQVYRCSELITSCASKFQTGIANCLLVFRRESSVSLKLTEREFDDILQRNKSVSSGAIMRAVQDASAGQFTAGDLVAVYNILARIF